MLRIGYNPYVYSNRNTSFGATNPIKCVEGEKFSLAELGITGDNWKEEDILNAMAKKIVGNDKKKKKTN